jgi:hypothetical protein
MRKLSTQGVAAAMIAFAFMFSMSVHEASGQSPQPTKTIKVPRGAKVQIQGSTARMIGPGVSGTYECNCESPGSGTCQVNQGPGGLSCSKGNGTCTSSCVFHTTTTGVVAPPIAAQPGSTQPSKGTVRTPNVPARQ